MVSHLDTRMNALLLPGVLMLSPRGGGGMDFVSGGESISALILLQMELFTSGQHLHLIWSSSSLFSTLLHLLLYLLSSNPFFKT